MSAAKITVAKKAIGHIEKKLNRNMVLGIGTGSTVNFFIEELAHFKNLFKANLKNKQFFLILDLLSVFSNKKNFFDVKKFFI